ncbi:hypothetical protein EX30DRAFT_331923 [Ascodesmis nigricans]|uniref:Lytic polysaccharide monooxygenase n=1 Tax=Ascodesmis nigricans TaxID=341454 RepID=A0A4V3SIL1_9PEZI|nr:hypothetical protein EX30DRAFT_331923 [Ascodesmis nigricans]
MPGHTTHSLSAKYLIQILAVALALSQILQVSAHMSMKDPPPFRYKSNPHLVSEPDYDMSAPLGTYPCKGYHSDFGAASGKSVATYEIGGSYSIELEGSAVHGGGSCQISLSYDAGTTFSVIQSYIGNCVNPNPSGSQKFAFTIPSNAPKGDAILAWTWFNVIGNREMYMNCASVTINSSSSGSIISGRSTSSSSLGPALFVANIGNECTTAEGSAVDFPNPGENVVVSNIVNHFAPVGNCQAKVSSGKALVDDETDRTEPELPAEKGDNGNSQSDPGEGHEKGGYGSGHWKPHTGTEEGSSSSTTPDKGDEGAVKETTPPVTLGKGDEETSGETSPPATPDKEGEGTEETPDGEYAGSEVPESPGDPTNPDGGAGLKEDERSCPVPAFALLPRTPAGITIPGPDGLQCECYRPGEVDIAASSGARVGVVARNLVAVALVAGAMM